MFSLHGLKRQTKTVIYFRLNNMIAKFKNLDLGYLLFYYLGYIKLTF